MAAGFSIAVQGISRSPCSWEIGHETMRVPLEDFIAGEGSVEGFVLDLRTVWDRLAG